VSDSKSAFSFEGVHLELGGRPILQDINFAVKRGEFACVIGASGCGKTTLLRLLAGLVMPTSGSVRLGDQVVQAPSRQVAVVFQDYSRASAFRRLSAPIVLHPCSPKSASPTTRRSIPRSFPAACSSGCRSRAVWRRIPRCC
jgi:ABC-type Mn2+/Zn2+ transport system ATPase subunit